MPDLRTRARRAWNAFRNNRDPTWRDEAVNYGRPDRIGLRVGRDRTIINAIYNRIASDVSTFDFHHVQVDRNDRYIDLIRDELNEALTVEANIDQSGRALIHDAVLTMLEEGSVAFVPIETDKNPNTNEFYTIYTMRVGKITQWRQNSVRVEVYNEAKGWREELDYDKNAIAIAENPFYSVMNAPNSTLQRLLRKMAILDELDEASVSGKLDLIIQLPYAVTTDIRKQQADSRRKDIEAQLTGSKYGIAYVDSTEHITQLNRSLENNLQPQIEYLTGMVYSQLGTSKEVFDGTADETQMLNYNNRTLEPIATAMTDAMRRSFLTKEQRDNGESIMALHNPFRLTPTNVIAEIAERFTRNEILSPNEVRGLIGFGPSDDPRSNELRNRNIAVNEAGLDAQETSSGSSGTTFPMGEGNAAQPAFSGLPDLSGFEGLPDLELSGGFEGLPDLPENSEGILPPLEVT